MFKKFFSLFMVFLLMPIASAGQDAAKESSALVQNGWVHSLEQTEVIIEDKLAAKTTKNQRFLTQTSQGMADLRTQCFKGEMSIDNWDLSQASHRCERRGCFWRMRVPRPIYSHRVSSQQRRAFK